MKKVKDQIRSQILAAVADGHKVEKFETQPQVLAALRKELGLKPGEAVAVEGVPVTELDARAKLHMLAISYGEIRWQVRFALRDVVSLFKAVPDEEMMSLIPIIVDQHLDDENTSDPVDEYDVELVDEMKKALKEIGFVDVEV